MKNVEDKISNDLHIYIDNSNLYLTIGLMIEIIVLIVIIIVILLSYTILRELLETGKMLNRAQENTKSGSYEYYYEDDIMFWSDELYKLLGLETKGIKPSFKTFAVFIHPDDRDIVSQGMELAIKSKKDLFF